MLKKLVLIICASMLSISLLNTAYAGGSDFESLFKRNKAEQLVFNMCGGSDPGLELKDACQNIDSSSSYIFSKNHTVTFTMPDGKQTAKWKAKGNKLYIAMGNTSFKDAWVYVVQGEYIATCSEESGDLIALKMQKPKSGLK